MLRQRWKDKNSSKEPQELGEMKPQAKGAQARTYRLPFFRSPVAMPVMCVGVFVYIILPLWFYFSPWLRRHLIFLPNINWPPFMNLSSPESFGLKCTRNFFVKSDEGVQVGVWHKLPFGRCQSFKDGEPFNFDFGGDRPVVFYLHGHAETRAANYRIGLYNLLTETEIDAHVVTFDYRGYGDSTRVLPSVGGVIKDAHAVYNWLKQRVEGSRIFIWGHSLGTGVAVMFVEELLKKGERPAALTLESPFNNIYEASQWYPLSIPYRLMPYFPGVVEAVKHESTNFNSEDRIGQITIPILILHAPDDLLVPYKLGRKLYERALADRPESLSPVQFVDVDGTLGCGHRHVYRDTKLPPIVKRFMDSALKSY